jgi:O-antigen/teichoic acid export membrane protein
MVTSQDDMTVFREPGVPAGYALGGQTSVARSTSVVFAGNISSAMLGAVRSFYLARTLVPADYGIWSLVSTILGYANYGDLGISSGFILKVSRLMGRGRVEEATRVRGQALTATLMAASFVAVLLFLASFGGGQVFGDLAPSMRIAALGVVTLALLNYSQVVARVQDRWAGIGLATFMAAAVFTAGLMVVGTMLGRLSVEHVALFSVMGSATAVLILVYPARPRPAWPLDGALVRRLVLIGIPVTLFPVGLILFQSVDRWIVAASVSEDQLGYYALGTTLGAFLYLVPTTLAVVLFTRQIAAFGATGDPRTGESFVLAPIQLSGYVMAWLAGAMILTMPLIIGYLTPAYGPSLRTACLQVVGNCVLFTIPVGANYLLSINQQWKLFILLGSAIICEMVLVSTFVRTEWGIEGAASAVLVSDVLFSAAVAFSCFRPFRRGLLAPIGAVALCFLPFVLCLPVALWLQTENRLTGVLYWDGLRFLGIGTVYVLVSGVLCLSASRVTGVLDHPFLATRIRAGLPAPLAAVLLGKR